MDVDKFGDQQARTKREEKMGDGEYITLEKDVLIDYSGVASRNKGKVKNRSTGNCGGVCDTNIKAKGKPPITIKYFSGESENICTDVTPMGTCGKNLMPIARQTTCPFNATKTE